MRHRDARLLIAARSVAMVVVTLVAAGDGLAIPLPPDPDEPPFDSSELCDPGHLLEFPLDPGEPFSTVRMASPTPGAVGVPRNVEIVLAGFLGDLDAVPPFLTVKLRDESGAEVAITRSANLVRPVAPLAPATTYRLSRELADPDSCVGCGLDETFEFTTGDELDLTPPSWSGSPLVQVLVFSPGQQQCGFVQFGATHLVLGRLPALSADIARLSVATKVRDGASTRALDSLARQPVEHFVLAGVEPIALRDDVTVAVTPVDLAGNAGAAVSVRVRARPFDDLRAAPFEDLDDRQCTLPGGVRPALAEVMPSNARFVVDMPMEPVPLALVGNAGALPLHPIEHLPFGQVLEPAAELPAGALLDLVTLPCEHCACIGCDVAAPVRFRVGSGPDEEPPAPPMVLAIEEDLEPPAALETCYPDRSALIVYLAPSRDQGPADVATPPEHLRYDATLRMGGELAVEIGRALPALLHEDGSVALRLDTARYGRLLGRPFELTIVATDLAGNRAEASYLHEPDATGCSSSRASATPPPTEGLGLLLLLALAASRRRGADPKGVVR